MKFPVNLEHELAKRNKVKAIMRFAVWQFKSRFLKRESVHNWISTSKFYVRNGETGLTQNIYVGLHEFEDMSFLLHFLRENDVFIDVGANSGSYSILAGAVCGANVLAIEPVETTYQRLIRNLALNNLNESSTALNVGLGAEEDFLTMTSGMDTTNKIVMGDTQQATVRVEIKTLDDVSQNLNPTLIKIDVEGWETNVLKGGLETLKKPSLGALIIELNESGAKYGYLDSEIVELLEGLSFRPYSYDPLNRELKALAGINSKGGNTIFIRNQERVAKNLESAEPQQILGIWI
jgi:FkbM family methyltransferase